MSTEFFSSEVSIFFQLRKELRRGLELLLVAAGFFAVDEARYRKDSCRGEEILCVEVVKCCEGAVYPTFD